MDNLTPGLIADLEHTVVYHDTASKWGSGMLTVFSTPSLVGLMESTAVKALKGHLPSGQTTVGSRIDVRHLAATPMGAKVHATATLMLVEGRKLVFKIQAWDEVELIGEADHERFIIDETRFMARVQIKATAK